SRPLDRAFALLDPLLARPALVVESNDALGRAAHVRHDEADAGIKFSGMPLDLAECDQQFPPSDGDCHTPLPCEVRKWKDTTPRVCCPKRSAPGAGARSGGEFVTSRKCHSRISDRH